MAYDDAVADRVRAYLAKKNGLAITEKKMFGGLAFMINDKMCVNVKKDRLMCRFDPDKEQELSQKNGYAPMSMKKKGYKGYCYVDAEGFEKQKDFAFWIELCLEYNERAKSSKK